MHPSAVAVASIWFLLVNGQEYHGSPRCGCLEEPAIGSHRKEKFCRQRLTPLSERNKPRSCICRPGLVRNSWGDCITIQECKHCRCFRDKDFNVCARVCPVMCNEPIRGSCSKKCVLRCDCPPDYLRDPKKKYRCVKATKCVLKCPQYSKFEFCVSTCAAKCGARPPRICVTRCQRGGCVCDQGYAEVEHNGESICVPQGECYRYLGPAVPVMPGVHGNVGGGISSSATTVLPGGVVGGAVGTASTAAGRLTPGAVGTAGVASISGSGAGGTVGTVSTGPGGFLPGSASIVGVPSISGSGVVGTVGTPSTGAGVSQPGSVNIEGASSNDIYGFGVTIGGIYSDGIRPEDSMESGEGNVRGGTTEASPTYPGTNGVNELLPSVEGTESVGSVIGKEGTSPHITSRVGGPVITEGITPPTVGRPALNPVQPGTTVTGISAGGAGVHDRGGLAPVPSRTNVPVASITDAIRGQPSVVGTDTLDTSLNSEVGTSLAIAGTSPVVPVLPGKVAVGTGAVGNGLQPTGAPGPVSAATHIPGLSSSVTTGFGSSGVGVTAGGTERGSSTVAGVGGSNIGVVRRSIAAIGGATVAGHQGSNGLTEGSGRRSIRSVGNIAGKVIGATVLPVLMAGVGAAAAGPTGLNNTGHHTAMP